MNLKHEVKTAVKSYFAPLTLGYWRRIFDRKMTLYYLQGEYGHGFVEWVGEGRKGFWDKRNYRDDALYLYGKSQRLLEHTKAHPSAHSVYKIKWRRMDVSILDAFSRIEHKCFFGRIALKGWLKRAGFYLSGGFMTRFAKGPYLDWDNVWSNEREPA